MKSIYTIAWIINIVAGMNIYSMPIRTLHSTEKRHNSSSISLQPPVTPTTHPEIISTNNSRPRPDKACTRNRQHACRQRSITHKILRKSRKFFNAIGYWCVCVPLEIISESPDDDD